MSDDIGDNILGFPDKGMEGNGKALEPPKKDNVTILSGTTTLDIPPERVLQAALDSDMRVAIVIGYDKEGAEYFATSAAADAAIITWLMNRYQHRLLNYDDETEPYGAPDGEAG